MSTAKPRTSATTAVTAAECTLRPTDAGILYTHTQPKARAVFFDVGGVLSESPLLAIERFEREARPTPLPPSYIGVVISAAGEEGLFQRLERGDEKLGTDFLARFAGYLCSEQAKQSYIDYVARRARAPTAPTAGSRHVVGASPGTKEGRHGDRSRDSAAAEVKSTLEASEALLVVAEARKATAAVTSVDTYGLFRCIIAASRVPVPEMIAAAGALRRGGVKVAAVSNDFLVEPGFVLEDPSQHRSSDHIPISNPHGSSSRSSGDGGDGGGSVYAHLPSFCDAIVLSSVIGCRKPAARIYEEACARLRVAASDVVFVDDIRANVRAAEELGMRAVWMRPGGAVEVRRAVEELEAVTGVRLTGAWGTSEAAVAESARGIREPTGKL